ncbi:MAG: glycoside hydrolase family 130 protein [Actinomycetota bacterium]
MSHPRACRTDAGLRPDPARVIARLYLPGEELPQAPSRVAAVVDRVLALDEAEINRLAKRLRAEFSCRHRDYEALIARHASVVSTHVGDAALSPARQLVLGATFTAEYAVEGAALCNPSAVPHPDQSGVADGQLRVAVSLRGIGEGHVSTIGFCDAVVGPGASWTFEDRPLPAVAGVSAPSYWRREHLHAVLADQRKIGGLISAVLGALPAQFHAVDLEQALQDAHPDLLTGPGGRGAAELMRAVVHSTYEVQFPGDVGIAQQVLMPGAPEERNGVEDARFTRFLDDNGAVEYRATYTAYDGRRITPRLLTSPDLRSFRAHRLAGPAARNKGMALFPRAVGGRQLALCRSDGERTSLTSSADGLVWEKPRSLQAPGASWELLQVGNCGPPIETDRGWLVLTHGVGPMRTYAIGALLLDLDEPARVIGRLVTPLLEPGPQETEGYVPNVVYSCGGLVHDGLLWIPYGIGDARISVAWTPLAELLDHLTSVR